MSMIIILLFACVLALCVIFGRHTKTCGNIDIAHTATCDREGRILRDVARRCMTILEHSSFRDTKWASRIRERWNGTIHQLVERGGAPAVTTHKQDIRLCLDHASSIDSMVFVCLHELSHIGVHSHGHTEEFWACLSALIDAATKMGVYTHTPKGSVCGTPVGPAPQIRRQI